MLYDVVDSYFRWGNEINPTLVSATSHFPRYLIPAETAQYVRHRVRSHPPSLSGLAPALVIDDDGAVLLHGLTHEPFTTTAPEAFTIGEATGPGVRSVEKISPRPLHCLASARFVVFQLAGADDGHSFFWCEGECGLGEAMLTSSGWLSPVDVSSSVDRVTMRDPETQALFTLGDLLRTSAAGDRAMEVGERMIHDMGTAIGTAIEQLDHVWRGCSLRTVEQGTLALPE